MQIQKGSVEARQAQHACHMMTHNMWSVHDLIRGLTSFSCTMIKNIDLPR